MRILGFFLIMVWIAAAQPLRAACGANGCPIDVQTAEWTEQGSVRIDYTWEYMDQSRPRIGRRAASVGEIPGHHDERFSVSRIQRLGVEVGLTGRLSVQGILPFVDREHQHIHHHHGAQLTETWNFSGLGDLELVARYALAAGQGRRPRVSAILGGVLPTGREAVRNADGQEAEVGISPGKGAYGLIAGAALNAELNATTFNGMEAKLPVFLSSTYRWNGQGNDDYRIGNFWLLSAGTVYPVFRRLGFMAQVNARVSRRDDRGNTREEIEKTGGTFVYLTPGIQLGLNETLWTFLSVQLPVYQRVNSIQLTSDYNLIGGLSYKFSVL